MEEGPRPTPAMPSLGIFSFRFRIPALYANGSRLTMLRTVFAGGTLVIMTKLDPNDFLEWVNPK